MAARPRPTIKELRGFIKASIVRKEKELKDFAKDQNPQVVELFNEVRGELSVLQAIDDYLHGDRIAIRLLSRSH